MLVDSEEFLKAFSTEWSMRVRQTDKATIIKAFNFDNTWTEFMLSGTDAFLYKICQQLNMNYAEEWYRSDALFVSGENTHQEGLMYPSCVAVCIEHENAENVEEEMWKLLFWRSRLKVLIFYDYHADAKTSPSRKNWLETKINNLITMGKQVNFAFRENPQTEYLFLVGHRKNVRDFPKWKYRIINDFSNAGPHVWRHLNHSA